jgi:hypothetical protein
MGDEEHMQQHQDEALRSFGGGGSGLGGGSNDGMGALELRPVFLGNLKTGYTSTELTDIFNRPIAPLSAPPGKFYPIPVDRVDLKRGYCFVFLKDATSQAHKDMAEQFVSDINGM